MPDIYLHLGSNIGDKEQHILKAMDMIEDSIGQIDNTSSFYITEAWGNEDQEEFFNLALKCTTDKSPDSVLDEVHRIENEMGRERKEKWVARKIDIDIIFYGTEILVSDNLTIPHKLMHKRNFVLIPMMEIASDFVHPLLGLSVEEIYINSEDNKEVYLKESE